MVLTRSSILTLEVASHTISFSGSMVDSTDWNGCVLLSLPNATHLLFPLRESHCVSSWLSCLCLLCWYSMPWTSTAGWCVEESQRCSAFTACCNHPPRSFEYMPGFKPKIQAHWSDQAVRNLSSSQRELNAQKILRPTNLCFSKIPQHRYMSVVY